MLGVALGVVAIVALGALVQGVTAAVDESLKTGGTDLTIFQAGVADAIFSSLEEAPTRAKLEADPDVVAIEAGLAHVMPIGGQRFTLVFGVDPGGFTYKKEDVDGPPIREADEVGLGVLAARMLKKKRGDTLDISGRTFRIVNTFSTGVAMLDSGIAIRLDTLQKMLGREGSVTAFYLDLREGVDPAVVADRLEAAHPELAAIASAAEYGKVDSGLEIARGAVWAVTLAAIIIGSVIVLNTMWMTVLERTREIGVLRAVGWSRGQVMATVLIESVAIGAAAMIVGAALGVLLAEGVARAPVTSQFVRPSFGTGQFALAGGAALVLSVIGGALPAWRAARISPAEALRYE